MGQVLSDQEIDPIDPLAPEFYCSKGFRELISVDGLDTLIEYMTDLTENPVISVGSGSGYVEKYCMQHVDKLKMILVDPIDPAENGFAPVPESLRENPSYPYVQDLIEAQPNIVGNCHLFINWSLPNDAFHDYESILQLNPIKIIICCEVSGTAGSRKLLDWLQHCGVDTSDLIMANPKGAYNITGPDYVINQSIEVNGYCSLGFKTKTMLIYLTKK